MRLKTYDSRYYKKTPGRNKLIVSRAMKIEFTIPNRVSVGWKEKIMLCLF